MKKKYNYSKSLSNVIPTAVHHIFGPLCYKLAWKVEYAFRPTTYIFKCQEDGVDYGNGFGATAYYAIDPTKEVSEQFDEGPAYTTLEEAFDHEHE